MLLCFFIQRVGPMNRIVALTLLFYCELLLLVSIGAAVSMADADPKDYKLGITASTMIGIVVAAVIIVPIASIAYSLGLLILNQRVNRLSSRASLVMTAMAAVVYAGLAWLQSIIVSSIFPNINVDSVVSIAGLLVLCFFTGVGSVLVAEKFASPIEHHAQELR
jgi:hypothetical protein